MTAVYPICIVMWRRKSGLADALLSGGRSAHKLLRFSHVATMQREPDAPSARRWVASRATSVLDETALNSAVKTAE